MGFRNVGAEFRATTQYTYLMDTVHGEVGGTGPSCNTARGSWEYNGESGRVLLGATAEEINQKDCEVLPWMSAVQGAGLYLSTTRESSKGSHRGPNTLPSDWSGLCRTFEVPEKPNTEGKAYILLYACSLTRAVYVDLVPNLEATEIIRSLKCFIAQRGRPQRIYSDNAKTFGRGSKLIKHPHPAED